MVDINKAVVVVMAAKEVDTVSFPNPEILANGDTYFSQEGEAMAVVEEEDTKTPHGSGWEGCER